MATRAIVWDASLAIGVPEIDAQHATMFERIDALMRACEEGRGKEEVVELMGFLEEYARKHFVDEETYCDAIGFPGAAAHREMHEEYVEGLMRLKATYEAEGATALLAAEINSYLVNWLITHIADEDQKIAEYARQIGQG